LDPASYFEDLSFITIIVELYRWQVW